MIDVFQQAGLASISLLAFVIIVYFLYYRYILRVIQENKPIEKTSFIRPVSIIVATYNEEKLIKRKLDNLLEQKYPKNMMEIIVVDSNSSDNTINIVKKFREEHGEIKIKIIEEEERRGKSHSINGALNFVDKSNEIVFMTDADALLREDAIGNAVACFQNKDVGAVTGMESILNFNSTRQAELEDTYRGYYRALREGESLLDSTAVFDGELAGYKFDLIKDFGVREDLNADDNQLAYVVRKNGYRSICCPDVVFYENAPTDFGSMRIQKVRRGQGLTRLFWYNRDILFNKGFGKFGSIIFPVNFFMHIISPFLVTLTLTMGLIFLAGISFQNTFYAVLILALTAIVVFTRKTLFNIEIFKTGWIFILYQIMLLEGMLLYISGTSLYKWKKVESVRNDFLS